MTEDTFTSLQYFDSHLLHELIYQGETISISNDTMFFENKHWIIKEKQKERLVFQSEDDQTVELVFLNHSLHLRGAKVNYTLHKEHIYHCYISHCGKVLSTNEVNQFDSFLLASYFYRKYTITFPPKILHQITMNDNYVSTIYDWCPRFEYNSSDEVDLFCKVVIEFQVMNQEASITSVSHERIEYPLYQKWNDCQAVTKPCTPQREISNSSNKEKITVELTPEEMELLQSILSKIIQSNLKNKNE